MILSMDIWLAWAPSPWGHTYLFISRAWGTNSGSPTPLGPGPASALTPVGFKLNIGPGGRTWVLVQIDYDSVPLRPVSRSSLLWSFLFYQVFSEDCVPPLSSFLWHYQSVTVVDASKATWLSIDPGRVLHMVGAQKTWISDPRNLKLRFELDMDLDGTDATHTFLWSPWSPEICLGSNEAKGGIDRIIWLQETKSQLKLAKEKQRGISGRSWFLVWQLRHLSCC